MTQQQMEAGGQAGPDPSPPTAGHRAGKQLPPHRNSPQAPQGPGPYMVSGKPLPGPSAHLPPLAWPSAALPGLCRGVLLWQ